MRGTLEGRQTAVELTSDSSFAARVRRLVRVSSIALGLVFVLTVDSVGNAGGAAVMVGLGWAAMPTILAFSLRRPRLRYLLAVPSTLVSTGVLVTALEFDGPFLPRAGWWTIAAGIGLGAVLGMWLWFRWMPVPGALHEPFSTARWNLIAVHVWLVVVGVLLVIAGSLG